MAIIPTQNKYPDRAGYLGLDTDRNVLVGMSDGILQDMTNSTPEGWVNVKDFGAKGDGVTDDTQAINAAITYAFNQSITVGWTEAVPTIYIPEGKYEIKEPNTLFSGVNRGGRLNIIGAGRYASILEYDIPSTVSTEFMIYNDGRFGMTKFKDLTFRSKNSNGNFFYGHPGISNDTQDIQWENIGFENFENIFKIEGTKMCSEFSFVKCRISGFSGVGFSFNNTQATNWTFYDTHIWGANGTLFKFIKSTSLNFIRGSIIPYNIGTIIEVPREASSNDFGPQGNPVYFFGTDFEMRGEALLINKQPHAHLKVIFDHCEMGGFNSSITQQIIWREGGELTFDHCTNMGGYYGMSWEGHGSLAQHLNIHFNYSDINIKSFQDKSTFTLLDAPYNTMQAPTIEIHSNDYLNNTKIYTIGFSQRNKNMSYHSISSSEGSDILASTPGGDTRIQELSLGGTSIQEIKLFPTNTTSGYAVTVEVKNQDETITLASFTWTPNTAPDVLVAYPKFNVPQGEVIKVFYSSASPNNDVLKGVLLFLF